MLRVAAELQDVPLAEAHVLEQHPGGVREVRNFGSGELHGPVAHGVVEANMRPTAFQQVEQLVAEESIERFGSRRGFLVRFR